MGNPLALSIKAGVAYAVTVFASGFLLRNGPSSTACAAGRIDCRRFGRDAHHSRGKLVLIAQLDEAPCRRHRNPHAHSRRCRCLRHTDALGGRVFRNRVSQVDCRIPRRAAITSRCDRLCSAGVLRDLSASQCDRAPVKWHQSTLIRCGLSGAWRHSQLDRDCSQPRASN